MRSLRLGSLTRGCSAQCPQLSLSDLLTKEGGGKRGGGWSAVDHISRRRRVCIGNAAHHLDHVVVGPCVNRRCEHALHAVEIGKQHIRQNTVAHHRLQARGGDGGGILLGWWEVKEQPRSAVGLTIRSAGTATAARRAAAPSGFLLPCRMTGTPRACSTALASANEESSDDPAEFEKMATRSAPNSATAAARLASMAALARTGACGRVSVLSLLIRWV